MAADASKTDSLAETPLSALHRRLDAKMVAFAGYAMPVQYPDGVLQEHHHTRAAAGLFDVSHMGQAFLVAQDGSDPAALLETLVPAELQALAPGRQRYTQFTNERGGILDDLMATRPVADLAGDRLYLVVNAACKEADFAHLEGHLAGRGRLERLDDRALIAVQGPAAAAAVAAVFGDDALLTRPFMSQTLADFDGATCWLSRSGYTGEDGFEISCPADAAGALAEALLAQDAVKPIGLGARDSLRLEAGLCLYGHDIDETTTPVEAGLAWSIGKRRRAEGGFPGAETILRQLADGPTRSRVGIRPDGRAPAREGVEIQAESGENLGRVTSGGFGPTVGGPVAMGYVPSAYAAPGTRVSLSVRGKALPAEVRPLPFYAGQFLIADDEQQGEFRAMSQIYFSEDHEWIEVEGDVGVVGITDYAQEQLGDVVFVETPDVGAALDQGDEAGVVESVKAASEIYSPVTGQVTEVNEELADNPGLVNEEPEDGAWFFKLKLGDPSELEDLMDAAAYKKFCKEQD